MIIIFLYILYYNRSVKIINMNILIIGGTEGLGLSTAKALYKNNIVTITSRNKKKLKKIIKEEFNNKVNGIVLDSTLLDLGGLNCKINNIKKIKNKEEIGFNKTETLNDINNKCSFINKLLNKKEKKVLSIKSLKLKSKDIKLKDMKLKDITLKDIYNINTDKDIDINIDINIDNKDIDNKDNVNNINNYNNLNDINTDINDINIDNKNININDKNNKNIDKNINKTYNNNDILKDKITNKITNKVIDKKTSKKTSFNYIFYMPGIAISKLFKNTGIKDFEKQINLNFIGMIRSLNYFYKNNKNNIIFTVINSTASLIPITGYSSYAPSKGCISQFIRSVREELKVSKTYKKIKSKLLLLFTIYYIIILFKLSK